MRTESNFPAAPQFPCAYTMAGDDRRPAGGTRAVAFAPASGTFVLESSESAVPLPDLLHGFRIDSDAIEDATGDFGGVVERQPRAVCWPVSAAELAAIVRFARTHSIALAARGLGNTFFGQSQTDRGITVNMSELAHVADPEGSVIEAGGGATWHALLTKTIPRRLAPPVVLHNLNATIGAVLSEGGWGGASVNAGFCVDHVASLTVVTGDGEIRSCSRTENRDLYDAVLCGQGTCGFIAAARIELKPIAARARVFLLPYPGNLDGLVNDLALTARDGRFTEIWGYLRGEDDDAPILEAAALYDDPASLDEDALLGDLGFDRDHRAGLEGAMRDMTVEEYVFRADRYVPFMKMAGIFVGAHPTFDVLLPQERAAELITRFLREGEAKGHVTWTPLVFAFTRDKTHQPLMRVPDAPLSVYLNIAWHIQAPTPQSIREHLDANAAFYDATVQAGGTRCLHAAIPMSTEEWVRHFGSAWNAYAAAKRKYDPSGLLGTGAGVFE